jgi:hypothetical protein
MSDITTLAVVHRAVYQTEGNPDWSAILIIVSMLDQDSLSVPTLLQFMHSEIMARRPAIRGPVVNSLMLIDALFKNSKSPTLKQLQCQQLSDLLNHPMIEDDAQLHNFLYECMPAWISALEEHQIANRKFVDFCQRYAATHFIPNITRPIRDKLIQDLTTADEILSLLVECVISAARGEPNGPLLEEIMGNVREISERLIELSPKIEEIRLKPLISATRDLCAVGIKAEAALKAGRGIGEPALRTAVSQVRANLESVSGKEPLKEKRVAPRRRAIIDDESDITDEAFWAELTTLKSGAPITLI